MTALILDDTANYPGQRVMHAIVIGVSDYKNLPDPGGAPTPNGFGLQKLTAASKTAIEIANWLKAQKNKLDVPIATIRLCVAPTLTDKLQQETSAPQGATGATRQEVADALWAWRAAQQPDDIALFYFAGHGIQRYRADMVLLCSDFAQQNDGPLSRAVELTNIYDGLSRTAMEATKARTQMFFVDACRERPAAIANFEKLNVPDVWPVTTLKTKDDRRAPIFYATTPGTLAYADAGVATLFSKTLLRCLESEAATIDNDTGEWQITSKSLERALSTRFRALAGANVEQECDSDHAMAEFLISKLNNPPMCTVKVQVDPDAALPVIEVKVRNTDTNVDQPLPQPLPQHPYEHPLPGGYYRFFADVLNPPQPYVSAQTTTKLVEPSKPYAVRLKVMP